MFVRQPFVADTRVVYGGAPHVPDSGFQRFLGPSLVTHSASHRHWTGTP
jgi:hypothetical protein